MGVVGLVLVRVLGAGKAEPDRNQALFFSFLPVPGKPIWGKKFGMAVGVDSIVLVAPVLDDHPGFCQGQEPFLIEALVTQAIMEAFHIGILPGTAISQTPYSPSQFRPQLLLILPCLPSFIWFFANSSISYPWAVSHSRTLATSFKLFRLGLSRTNELRAVAP